MLSAHYKSWKRALTFYACQYVAHDHVLVVVCILYRKKRKWDVPGTAPAPVAVVAPSILGQPFGAGPDHVAAAAASQLLHKYPQLAVPQAAPMGVPNSSAAEEIRKKINQVGAVTIGVQAGCAAGSDGYFQQ